MLETTILQTLEKLPESLKQEVLHYAEFLAEQYVEAASETSSDKKRHAGALRGTFVLPLPNDFDEPLSDFEEYKVNPNAPSSTAANFL